MNPMPGPFEVFRYDGRISVVGKDKDGATRTVAVFYGSDAEANVREFIQAGERLGALKACHDAMIMDRKGCWTGKRSFQMVKAAIEKAKEGE